MPIVARTGEALIRLGMGPLVARVATVVYGLKSGSRSRFSIDDKNNWVNAQQEVTFVSPTVHTLSYSVVRETVRDIWEFSYAPQSGDVVIDVGAGIGTESVVFAREVSPAGRVIAVEAHPSTCEALRRTVARSGLNNVTVIHAGIADQVGHLMISDSSFHIGNSVIGVTEGVRVPASTLDQLVTELKIDRVDYLKMNIEGAESLAIQGMAGMIGTVRQIAIACHDFIADEGGPANTRTLQLVRSFLTDNGFDIIERSSDPRPWVRDQVYGVRRSA